MKNTKTYSELRNELHNSFSVKNHVPAYQGKFAYKGKYENQLRNNKFLLGFSAVSIVFSIVCVAGSIARNSVLVSQIDELRTQNKIGLEMAVQYSDLTDRLETELASCSASLKEKKLSPKARAHVKQQPVVAEKIKLVFGDSWVEATELLSRESSLNPSSVNKSSGACGLGQALPCEKMACSLTDVNCQLNWTKDYIQHRYGTTLAALYHHDMTGWY